MFSLSVKSVHIDPETGQIFWTLKRLKDKKNIGVSKICKYVLYYLKQLKKQESETRSHRGWNSHSSVNDRKE